MLKLTKSAIEEIAENTNAPVINRMTDKEQSELKKNDSPKLFAMSMSKTNGVTTAALYAGKSGRIYLQYGQPFFGW